MFVAVAVSNQLFKAVLFFAKVSVKSRALPLALTRLREVSKVKSAAVSRACPFLFDHQPSVSPPPPPRQTLPKLHVCVDPAQVVASGVSVNEQEVAVVAIVVEGFTSATLYVPGRRFENE